MANRFIPYGYEITDGEIQIINSEKTVIENIFGLYINHHTLLDIANRLNESGISYNNDNRTWNKNIIKRILENEKYIGKNGYPQIIAESTFEMVDEVRSKKSFIKSDENKEIDRVFRTNLVCGCCGGKLYRYKGNERCRNAIYRRCKNPNCESPATSITEIELKNGIQAILNYLINNYNQIQASTIKDAAITNTTAISEGEAHNEQQAELLDTVAAIVQSAELRFMQCLDQDYTAIDKKIRQELCIRAENKELDIQLLKSIVKQIRLYPGKVIELQLINGTTFKGGE